MIKWSLEDVNSRSDCSLSNNCRSILRRGSGSILVYNLNKGDAECRGYLKTGEESRILKVD